MAIRLDLGRLAVGGVALLSASMMTGFAMAHYATGGATLQTVARAEEDRPLANPDALSPDRHILPAGYEDAAPATCIGCGPGIATRRAMQFERGDDGYVDMDYAALVAPAPFADAVPALGVRDEATEDYEPGERLTDSIESAME